MAKAQATIPLDIAGVRVLKTEINTEGELIITIESTKRGTSCRKCGHWIEKFHGHADLVTIRHLPVFGRPRRYVCQDCPDHPTTAQQVDWRDPYSRCSFAFEEHLLLQLVDSTIRDVSIKERIACDEVLGVLERRIEKQVDWSKLTELEMIGLDEIGLKKGQREYVTIVTDRLAGERIMLLGVLPNRQKDQVVAFLRSIPQRLSETIRTVCCDMYEGYTEAVREELLKAEIVVVRFHVTHHYRQAADKLSQRELKRLKEELPEEALELKGRMWAFRKQPEDLTTAERRVLKKLFQYAPQVKQAYPLREKLSEIFDQKVSKAVGCRKVRSWIKKVEKSVLKCFDGLLKTLEQWWEAITNYFDERATNGFVEGLNNNLKVLKRRCYGIFNREHLFQRISLDLDGYHLFAWYPPDMT